MQIKNFTDIKSLLFDNVNIKQTIFKNAFWLAAANGISKLLKFVLFIYIARILGATEYGKFTFALAFIGLFAIFSDLGLNQIITRDLAKEKEKEKEFPAILSLKFILSFGTLLLIFFLSFFITPDPLIRKVIWILAICVLVEHFYGIIFAFFQARQKMEYQAFANIFGALLVTGVGLFVLFYFPSVQNLSYSYLFTALVVFILVLAFFHFKIQKLSFIWDKSIWQRFLLMSWPLALIGMAGGIYNQTDSVMLGYFGHIAQTGWYNAAYRIIGATLILMGLISASIFPALSKSFGESKEKLQKIWDYYMELMVFLAIPLVIGGIVLAPKIINFVYGQSYAPSILAFKILIISSGIIFLYIPLQQILIVSNWQKKTFWAVIFGAIFNIILNLILIPKFSLYGAAVATVATHILVGILILRFTLKLTSVSPFNFKILSSFIGAVISSFLMYFIVSHPMIYNLNIIFSVLVGALIYFAAFLILRYTIRILKPSYEKI